MRKSIAALVVALVVGLAPLPVGSGPAAADASQSGSVVVSELTVGRSTAIRGKRVPLLDASSADGEEVAVLRSGDMVTVVGAAEEAGATTWWPVEASTTGQRGWVRWEFLVGAYPARYGVVARAASELDAFWQAEAGLGGYWAPDVRRFADRVLAGCGPLETGHGPAYCPIDGTIYIDMGFLEGTGLNDDEFLVKVIMAHEWAHHIQGLAGIAATAFPDEAGEVFGLQLELHADCLAGVWASSAEADGEATDDDILRGAALAFALGDPAGSPLLGPDAHGPGEYRAGAFALGYDAGQVGGCAGLLSF